MERAAGIEPACLTWKDSALPLSYARDFVGDKTGSWRLRQAFFSFSNDFVPPQNSYRKQVTAYVPNTLHLQEFWAVYRKPPSLRSPHHCGGLGTFHRGIDHADL
jgi:hypothetical protein